MARVVAAADLSGGVMPKTKEVQADWMQELRSAPSILELYRLLGATVATIVDLEREKDEILRELHNRMKGGGT